MHIHHRLLADTADIDGFAAAAQRVDGVHQERAGGSGAETVDDGVDAIPTGQGARPVGGGFAFILWQDFDPLRRQSLDPIKTLAVARRAENAGDAPAERA